MLCICCRSHSSTYRDSTSSPSSTSVSQSYSSHHISSTQQHQSAASSSSSSHQLSSVSTTSSQPHPWQPFTHPAPQSPPHPTLPSPHLPPPPPYIDSNMPLNLSVSSSSSSHIGHSAAARQASLPRASLMATTGAPSSSRGEDSSSPGVPESVAGRRVMTYNGLVFYPTPVHGASLPNMEAKTHRDVDSGGFYR